MPRRGLGTFENILGYATHNTRWTTTHKVKKKIKNKQSKFHYQLNPPSNKESDLHQNIINAHKEVTSLVVCVSDFISI